MNQVNLVGNIVKDIEERVTPSGMAVANFVVAIDDGFGDKKTTDYIKCVVFDKQAENCAKFLSKGSKVGVTGRIKTGDYSDKDGKKIYTTEVICSRVEFLSPKSETVATTTASNEKLPTGFEYATVTDDEIPFG